MSKYGVVGLSLGLRAAAAAHGVQVHVVCPGVIDIADRRGDDRLVPLPGDHRVEARR
jgi:NAD(P)-dependent dehydrogenase (short-subunit alcohol dehydrogenase family)